jgi:light-regulated signal transduction histidine kinase (bacteriophytochrome)
MASTDIYRGLHFPSTDIPKQARELYLINKIRVLYDRDQKPARLICRTFEDAQIPLDLKHSYLRAMSPIHLKYLANIGVQASMSISLTFDQKLWGLISCHNYGHGPRSGMRLSLPMREICRGLGTVASSNIEKVLYISRIKARRSLVKAPPNVSPFVYITSSSTELLNMFGADLGFLVIKGEARTIGKLVTYNECILLLQYIRRRRFTTIFSTNCIQKECPDLDRVSEVSSIAGMLVIPLSMTGSEFLVFLRRGKEKEIHWAGNPYEKSHAGSSHLEPRSSFRRWSENVKGTSREWTEDEG